MNEYMPLIVDAAAVLLVLLFIKRAYKKGFVRSIVHLVGFFISLIAANAISRVAAEYVFDYLIREKLVGMVFEQVVSMGDASGFLSSMETALADVPQVLLNAMKFAGLADFAIPDPSQNIGELARQLVDHTLGPTCIALLSTIFFLISFSLFMFLTRNLSKVFTGLRHVPLVGSVNSFLGGCLGAVEGVAYLYVLISVLSLVMALAGDSLPFLTRDMIEGTLLVRHLLDLSAMGELDLGLMESFAAVGQAIFG